jgi:hypothetical protein
MSRYKIIRNSVRCLACQKELESKHVHDFQGCGCPNGTFVDGGLDYTRRGAVNFGLVEDTGIYEEIPDGS